MNNKNLKLYNTLNRKEEEFKPIEEGLIKMYTCGPTVYNYAHIGNLRTYVFEDILKRVLVYNGYKINHVMNITDVGHLTDDADNGEDKMEKGSRREGRTAKEIADFYTEAFKKDLEELNILPANTLCKATENIPEQIAMVQTLVGKGFTYETSDGIYFDTTKDPEYGKLAQLKKQKLKAGARVDMGEKKNPHDFALWKFSLPEEKRQMEWPAFGRMGFPGWHIECSAMSIKYLGEHFDIHCGGIDHVPVHHTNEITQSENATGQKPWVNYWLHGEFILMNSNKMAKSADNFVTLQVLKEKGFKQLAYRFLLLQGHYRSQINFTFEALQAAQNGYNNLVNDVFSILFWLKKNHPIMITNVNIEKTPVGLDYLEKFKELINSDLDTPSTIHLLIDVIQDPNLDNEIKIDYIQKFDSVLGLNLISEAEKKFNIPENIISLKKMREIARAIKNWTESDRLRDELLRYGYQVKDTPDGDSIIIPDS